MRPSLIFSILFTTILFRAAGAQESTASSVEITILSSNLADGATVGEWGFSALARVDDQCVLFDAGRYPDTVLRNAKVLEVDLSCVTDVVLSHFHFDHTTGLLPLLENLRSKNPNAIRRVHVAEGFFLSRRMKKSEEGKEWNQMIAIRQKLEDQGVEIIGQGKGVISSLLTIFFPFSSTHLLLSTPTFQHTDLLMPGAPFLNVQLTNYC
jgi:7,8-dihydropterin-6-yl-methyl-4-(beta-D-ribofuranosyl)aminobenzene 5'-phosphate synthase